MDTVGTGRASQLRLPERQFGWRPPHPRRRRRPSISGTRFITSQFKTICPTYACTKPIASKHRSDAGFKPKCRISGRAHNFFDFWIGD